jgi:uncharacterized protein YbaP (TraB family)
MMSQGAAWRKLQSSEPHMIVVGAAHLVGEHGIFASLLQKGYTIEQL